MGTITIPNHVGDDVDILVFRTQEDFEEWKEYGNPSTALTFHALPGIYEVNTTIDNPEYGIYVGHTFTTTQTHPKWQTPYVAWMILKDFCN